MKGTSGVFRIGRMTPAEYTYMRIMQDRGVELKFLEPSSRRFKFNGTAYTPDFYDPKRRIYYEVSGTRQAFHANKKKYAKFITTYPNYTLKIVKPDGTEIQGPRP